MATTMYGLGRNSFLNAGINWTGGDNFNVSFVTSGYTPNFTTDQFYSIISGGNIIARSGNLASLSSALGTANAANETVSSVSGAQFSQVILFKTTGTDSTSPLIMDIDTATGLPCTPNGGNIVVQWDTGTNKIFTLCRDVDYVGQGAWSSIRDAVGRLFDRTYTGKIWRPGLTILKLDPTPEQAAVQAAWEERQAKAKEIEKRFGGRIQVFN